MSKQTKGWKVLKIGITMGDINGIGPEVIIKALNDQRLMNYMTPVIYGSTKALSYYRKLLKIESFNYSQVKNEGQFLTKKVNVVNCWNNMIEINAGQVSTETGKASFQAIEKATEDLKKGVIDALVTGPINKHSIQSDEFKFPGHTEYFAQKFEAQDSLMFMISDELKVGVVTGHIPVHKISDALTKELIFNKLRVMNDSLKNDFGINKPRIAVLGLNPHAGEDGLLGSEEDDIIKPAIHDFKKKGNMVFGPYPADGFFGKGDYRKFDGVLAMYHDQGLIPFKSIVHDSGVNYTAGLSAIRTSPDHGTAYAIAGKNLAKGDSLRAAMYQAQDISRNRNVSLKE